VLAPLPLFHSIHLSTTFGSSWLIYHFTYILYRGAVLVSMFNVGASSHTNHRGHTAIGAAVSRFAVTPPIQSPHALGHHVSHNNATSPLATNGNATFLRVISTAPPITPTIRVINGSPTANNGNPPNITPTNGGGGVEGVPSVVPSPVNAAGHNLDIAVPLPPPSVSSSSTHTVIIIPPSISGVQKPLQQHEPQVRAPSPSHDHGIASMVLPAGEGVNGTLRASPLAWSAPSSPIMTHPQ
jgi:hypothetical protein